MPIRSHEDVALSRGLTDEECDALVAEFVNNSDVIAIATKLDLPTDLVLRALEDGRLAIRALAAKRGSAVVRFTGMAIDRLLAIIDDGPGKRDTREVLQSIKLLGDILNVDGAPKARVGRPNSKPTPADEAKARRGAFEDALPGEEDDDLADEEDDNEGG